MFGFLFYSVENAIGILTGTALNLGIALGNMDILTILILPICEHGLYFHLFVPFSTSLISVSQCSVYRAFISLAEFIPKHVDPPVHGTDLLIHSGISTAGRAFTPTTTTVKWADRRPR